MANQEQLKKLVAEYPDLKALPLSDWHRAAKHLDDAKAAREEGQPCPWCKQ